MTPLRVCLVIAAAGATLLLAACDGDEGGSESPTATAEARTATTEGATSTAANEEPTATLPRPANEAGEEPFFYRTLDGFETLRANEQYKVLLRITNGYAEETLIVRVEREGEAPLEFESLFSEPQGEELPGSYYPTNIEVPEPGAWTIVVEAGGDRLEIPIEAAPAEG